MKDTYSGRWFMLAVASLGLGGSFAFLLGMSRMPVMAKYFPADYFTHALVGHVDLAILFWLLISAIVLWSHFFVFPGPKISFPISAAGAALVAATALTGTGEAVLNNYVPTIIHPAFFLGLGLFFAGFSINVAWYFGYGLRGLAGGDIVTNTLGASLVVALVMIADMIVSLALLGGDTGYEPQAYYERLFWTPGHIQQVLNGSLLASTWHALDRASRPESAVEMGAAGNNHPSMPAYLKWANRVLIVSALALFSLTFILDPLDKNMRAASEAIYGIGLGIPLFVHIGYIVTRARPAFYNPVSMAMFISIAIYTFGILIAYGGFGNDTRVPAHYHGAVTALTLALMGFAVRMFRHHRLKVRLPRMAAVQPYIYGFGMFMFITGLFVSGVFGAPRKTFGTEWTDNPMVLASLTLMGLGTIMAVIGGIIFVLYSSVTLIKEERIDD